MSKIIEIIENHDGFYEGNLRHYYKVVFNAPNVNNPYHNFRHMIHVLCQTYEAALYCSYHEIFGARKFRALLIAALFHDFGHSGQMGNDAREIAVAIKAMIDHILEEDRDLLPLCSELIAFTEYPYVSTVIPLGSEILRDADMSQTMSDVWLQQIVFGLAQERNIKPLENLQNQINFLLSIKFHTSWGKDVLARQVGDRIKEVREFVSLLR